MPKFNYIAVGADGLEVKGSEEAATFAALTRLLHDRDQLSEYLARELEARRKVKSAMMYPAVVAAMSVGTVAVLAIFVLPRFKDFFASLDAKLPLPTRMLLATTGFMTDKWWIFPILLLAFAGLALWSFRTEKGRSVRNHVVLSTPVVGDLVTHAIL